jgi:MHS family alpha-ketoglutarate permease-like MFS transporter
MKFHDWRIPFVTGALLGIYAIFLSRGLEALEVFKSEVAHEQAIGAHTSTWQAIGENRKAVITMIGLTGGPTLSYNTWGSGATTDAINFKHVNAR